jgi:prepilin-type N-terminal cleavage/methylation domain-containing protein
MITQNRIDKKCGASRSAVRAFAPRRRGFTLVELLVVITIILIVSAVALPTVLPALSHRQVSEAARTLQSALAGAHDSAMKTDAPAGLRFLPDPAFPIIFSSSTGQIDFSQPLAANRMIPLESAPDYSEGMISIIRDAVSPFATSPYSNTANTPADNYPYPADSVTNVISSNASNVNVLMVEECPVFFEPTTGAALANEPTSWFWNIRVGDKISIGNAGQLYTVVGPLSNGYAQGNSELFVNDGAPGAPPLLSRTYTVNGVTAGPFKVEYLFLVNGVDDDKDGFVDDAWDGVDNNLNNNIDEYAEWTEAETWLGSLATLPFINSVNNVQIPGLLNQSYTITRRPIPSARGRETTLPSNVVIDLTTIGSTQERTRVPAQSFNHYTGYVDVLINPDGTIVPTTIYSSPSSFGLSGAFLHFWLAERSDVVAPSATVPSAPYLPIGTVTPFSPLVGSPSPWSYIAGEYRIVTLFSRTGKVSTVDNVEFDNPLSPILGTKAGYDTTFPFIGIVQGSQGSQ